jgi:hypothetical protein
MIYHQIFGATNYYNAGYSAQVAADGDRVAYFPTTYTYGQSCAYCYGTQYFYATSGLRVAEKNGAGWTVYQAGDISQLAYTGSGAANSTWTGGSSQLADLAMRGSSVVVLDQRGVAYLYQGQAATGMPGWSLQKVYDARAIGNSYSLQAALSNNTLAISNPTANFQGGSNSNSGGVYVFSR